VKVLIAIGLHSDLGAALWHQIGAADQLSCVLDGDTVTLAAHTAEGDEVPLVAEMGSALWEKKQWMGERLAHLCVRTPASYRERVQCFNRKPIQWRGNERSNV